MLNDTVYRVSQKSLHTSGLTERPVTFAPPVIWTVKRRRPCLVILWPLPVIILNRIVRLPHCCAFVVLYEVKSNYACVRLHALSVPREIYPLYCVCVFGLTLLSSTLKIWLCPEFLLVRLNPFSLHLIVWKLFVCEGIFCCAAIVYKNPFNSISNEIAQSDWSYFNW